MSNKRYVVLIDYNKDLGISDYDTSAVFVGKGSAKEVIDQAVGQLKKSDIVIETWCFEVREDE